jgi:DNA-binding CsgD family transcriptional regulator
MESASLIKKFQLLVDSVHIEPEDIDYSILNHHIRLLDRISMVENSSLTVYDMFQKKYVFVRNRFKDILGYDEQLASEEGYSYFFKLMHPDDLPMVIDTTIRALSFMNESPLSEKQDYKTVFEHRLRDSSGKYIRFLQQEATLELDLKGNLWLILILLDVCPNQQETKVFQRSMMNIRTGKNHMFKVDEQETESELSRREIEILGLLGKGYISKEIADRLYISVNTVNNHRQNIIRKMGLLSTSEALAYAQKTGIV